MSELRETLPCLLWKDELKKGELEGEVEGTALKSRQETVRVWTVVVRVCSDVRTFREAERSCRRNTVCIVRNLGSYLSSVGLIWCHSLSLDPYGGLKK